MKPETDSCSIFLFVSEVSLQTKNHDTRDIFCKSYLLNYFLTDFLLLTTLRSFSLTSWRNSNCFNLTRRFNVMTLSTRRRSSNPFTCDAIVIFCAKNLPKCFLSSCVYGTVRNNPRLDACLRIMEDAGINNRVLSKGATEELQLTSERGLAE